jgi:hypothetical protein
MTNQQKAIDNELDRLADLLMQEVLNTPDDDILAEVINEYGDLPTFEAEMQHIFDRALNDVAKARDEVHQNRLASSMNVRRWGDHTPSTKIVRLGEFALHDMISCLVEKMMPCSFATGDALAVEAGGTQSADTLPGVQMTLANGFSLDVLKKELPWIGEKLMLIRASTGDDNQLPTVVVVYAEVNESGPDRGRLLLALRDPNGRKSYAKLCRAQPSTVFVGDALDSDWMAYTLEGAIGRST